MTRISGPQINLNRLQQSMATQQPQSESAVAKLDSLNLDLSGYLQHNPDAAQFLALAGIALPSADMSGQQLGVLNLINASKQAKSNGSFEPLQNDGLQAETPEASVFSLERQLQQYTQEISHLAQLSGYLDSDLSDVMAMEQVIGLMLLFGVPPEQIDQQMAQAFGQYGGWTGAQGGYATNATNATNHNPAQQAGRWSAAKGGGAAPEQVQGTYTAQAGNSPKGFGYNASMLRTVVPGLSAARANELIPHLNNAMHEAGISSKKEQAAFVAQLAHESGGFKYFEELASGQAYEGRRDLGNTRRGDGRRFKGRGPIQLTGRANYRKAGKALGLDLEGHPELAKRTDVGFRTAAWFWKTRGVGKAARAGNFRKATKLINGGYNGYASRLNYYNRAMRLS